MTEFKKYTRTYYQVNLTSLPEDETNQDISTKGFVDPFKSQSYETWTITGEPDKTVLPTGGETADGYKIKAQGYSRWQQLITSISGANIFYLGNVDVNDEATHYISPTTLSFIIGYESADVLVETDVDGNEVLGADALKMKIAKHLTKSVKWLQNWFDGTEILHGSIVSTVSGQLNIKPCYTSLELALANITTSEISNFEGEPKSVVDNDGIEIGLAYPDNTVRNLQKEEIGRVIDNGIVVNAQSQMIGKID